MNHLARWMLVIAAVVAIGGGLTLAGVATSQEQEEPEAASPWDDPIDEFNWPNRFTRADKIDALEQVLVQKRESLAELEQAFEAGEFTGENGDDPYDLARQQVTALRNLTAKLEEYLAQSH